MNRNDFYVGWDKGTAKSRRIGVRFFLSFFFLAIFIIVIFTLLEKPFADSYYAFGKPSEIYGELLEKPVIAVRLKKADGYEIIPLVGYGKMGPHAALSSLLGKGNYAVKLKGTLIEYRGNKLFELTKEGVTSVLEYEKISKPFMTGNMGSVMTMNGEIVDPKCFFGVMKPGYGKVHKSCAIRCISGQIPPILAIRENNKFVDYYFLTDNKGNVLMRDLQAYVGTHVKVSGVSYEIDNWKSIRLESLELALNRNTLTTICGLY